MQFRYKRVQNFHKVFAAQSIIEKHTYGQIDLYTTISIRFYLFEQ